MLSFLQQQDNYKFNIIWCLLVCSGDHTIKLHSWPEGQPVAALQENGHTRTPWTVSGSNCADSL
jgi:hypothetical protein